MSEPKEEHKHKIRFTINAEKEGIRPNTGNSNTRQHQASTRNILYELLNNENNT